MESILILELASACAYDDVWPTIRIIINKQLLHEDIVINRSKIEIKFESQFENSIEIHLANKRNGPDIWDTILDNNGNILKDQFIQIKHIQLNKCSLNFLISDLNLIGNQFNEKTNGYMGFNGHFAIDYTEPFYDWLQDVREKNLYFEGITESSLPFITNYVYRDNKEIDNLLDTLQETVNNARNKDASNNNSVFRAT